MTRFDSVAELNIGPNLPPTDKVHFRFTDNFASVQPPYDVSSRPYVPRHYDKVLKREEFEGDVDIAERKSRVLHHPYLPSVPYHSFLLLLLLYLIISHFLPQQVSVVCLFQYLCFLSFIIASILIVLLASLCSIIKTIYDFEQLFATV